MLISYNWLKEYLKIKLSPEKLAEELTLKAFEVEEIRKMGKGLDKIFVGKILDIKPHPKADKLQLVTCDLGSKKLLTFVCGAFNIKKGQKVPLVLAGSSLPDGTLIKEVTFRGIKSPGMLCSEKELGLGEDASGIMILDSDLKIGQSLAEAMNLNDVILDIDVLPNRSPDCLSHLGIARECSAITNSKFRLPPEKPKEDRSLKIKDFIKVKVADKKLCPRYTARVITNIEVKDSPQWMKNRLMACGLRPINNIVDVTNYVMLEYGQPLHAFDGDKLADGQIIIRRARDREIITTLDKEKRELTKEMLVIADSEKPVAIAGIIGGLNSEVSEKTKTVVLESANFNPLNIRQTSNKLNIRTEASDRFGYGLDPNLASRALDRATYLIQNLAGGKVVSGIVDFYPKKIKPKRITLNLDWLNKFLGVKISPDKITGILKSLEIESKISNQKLQVIVPTFRLDLNIPEDIAEEIARVYGYDRIEEKNPTAELKPIPKNKSLDLENDIKDILVGAGYTEVYNYSFVGENLLKKTGLKVKGHLKIKNPLSQDLAYLRMDLVPRMLEKVSENLRYFKSFKLFELDKIYMPLSEKELPCESKMICGVVASEERKNKILFYQAKGAVELLFNKLGIKDFFFKSFKSGEFGFQPYFHLNRTAKIVKGSDFIGTVFEINPKTLAKFDISAKVAVFSLSFDVLCKLATEEKVFQKIPRYPAVTLDLSFVLAKKVLHDQIRNAILETGKPLVKEVDLFDVYEGKPLKENQKSLAFHLTYQAEDRTLKDREVKAVQEKIIKTLKEKFGAEIREK